MFGFRNKTDDDGEETESFPQHAMSTAVKMHTLHVLCQWQATRKTQFLRSQHAQLRKWQGKVEAWPSRQKWRSHPKFLIAITLYSPLLLLCLFMVLHWCRVAQDGGPLTATTSTTSAPGRSSHNWAAATFFSIAARPYDVCEMTPAPAYAKWLRFPRRAIRLDTSMAFAALLSRPRARILAAKWSCECMPNLRSVLCLTMRPRCQHAGSFRALDCWWLLLAVQTNFGALALDMSVVRCCRFADDVHMYRALVRMRKSPRSPSWDVETLPIQACPEYLNVGATGSILSSSLRVFDATYDERVMGCPKFGCKVRTSTKLKIKNTAYLKAIAIATVWFCLAPGTYWWCSFWRNADCRSSV